MRTTKTIEEQLGIQPSKKDRDISRAIEKAGAFYCFSNERFDELKKTGVKYCNYGGGLVCPIDTVEQMKKDISKAVREDIKRDIKENGEEDIIKRTFYNFEGNIEDTIEYLRGYNIEAGNVLKATKGLKLVQ